MQFSTIFLTAAAAAMAPSLTTARPIPILIPANAHVHHARSLDIADLWVDKRFTGINNAPAITV